MPTPAAAQKLVDEAEALHKEIYDVQEEQPTEDKVETVTTVEEAEPVTEDAPQEPVTAKDESQEPAPIAKEETDWEQRYKTLQGKYNAELPRLQGQVRDLETIIAQMQVVTKPDNDERKPEAPTAEIVTAEDVEDYGEDFINVVRRVAQQEYMPLVKKLEAENEQLRSNMGQVQSTVAQTARQRMISALTEQVPTWRDINVSDDFMIWLGEYDAYAGAKRHDLLLKAFEDNDETRTIAFFKGYQNEHAAVTSEQQPQARPAKVDLETLVSPGKASEAKSVRAQDGLAGKQWSEHEINLFYQKVTAGKYRGKEKEKARIEADIIKAAKEGRIK